MATYTIEWADGRVMDIAAANDSEAEKIALARCGYDDAVAADQWDANGIDDDGRQHWRLLIWADEANSENDDGANAVAQVCVVR